MRSFEGPYLDGTCLVFCVHGKVEGSPFEIRGLCFFVHGAEVLVPFRRPRGVRFHLALRRSVPSPSPFHLSCTFGVASLRRFVASWGGVPLGFTTLVRPNVSVDRWIHRKGIPPSLSLPLSLSVSLPPSVSIPLGHAVVPLAKPASVASHTSSSS